MNRTYLALLMLVAFAACVGLAAPAQTPPDKSSGEESSEKKKDDPKQTQAPKPSDESEVRTPQAPTAEDIINAFQEERPRVLPLLPSGRPDETVVRRTGDAPKARPRLPDGYILADRTGRISKINDRWVFTFESDNESHPEPPITLLECQTLERMVRESRGGIEPVVFILTGEITDFRGENYLLPRMALRKRDMGNLRK